MSTIEEKNRVYSLVEKMKLLKEIQDHCGVKKAIHSELWHACAGPLVTLPQVGSLVYYFPQGHSEQVAATTNRIATTQVPNYPNLPSKLLCQLLSTTLHADKATDEIYAQMSLQPLNNENDVFPIPDIGMSPIKHPSEFFCKILTPSDTSSHGGFSVPRRAAEKLFPSLDFSMQPPNQELIVRDLHDNTYKFRHIYRGQPKRHLLTTGWSTFVSAKRLKAGDTILFIRDEKSKLLLGVRRASRQQTTPQSSVLSTDSMHIGVLAAAAHAATNTSPFTVFYNPRACCSEFVIPMVKYRKSVYRIQLSVGMRFGMMFETEESGKRRHMGTITGISDVDPLRWPESKWHNIQVDWDEPKSNDKQNRVSPWDIETPESLFIFPSLTSTLKRPFGSSFIGEETVWSEQLSNMSKKAQTTYNNGPILPVIQKAFAISETVKSEHSPLDPTNGPQNLVNEQPVHNHFSPLEHLETWDAHDDVYNAVLNEFKDNDLRNHFDCLVNNSYSSSQDVLSQFTSSSNEELTDTGVLLQNGSWQKIALPPRVRTYTKIQKVGSVGRSIDVCGFKNYDELCCEIERMFGLEGLLNDSIGSGWNLVYEDFENDILLVGDDPWEEFVGCVRCIRILSPCEVRQMGEEGMQLLNNSTAELQALIA